MIRIPFGSRESFPKEFDYNITLKELAEAKGFNLKVGGERFYFGFQDFGYVIAPGDDLGVLEWNFDSNVKREEPYVLLNGDNRSDFAHFILYSQGNQKRVSVYSSLHSLDSIDFLHRYNISEHHAWRNPLENRDRVDKAVENLRGITFEKGGFA